MNRHEHELKIMQQNSEPPKSLKEIFSGKSEDELLEEVNIEMGKGSPYNPKTNSCEYSDSSWCDLPKFKHCKHCLRCKDGTKACELEL